MRDIKFRAWDTTRNIMLTMKHDANIHGLTMFFDSVYNDQAMYDSELKLMQFTGITDINGKEIYEGDIVKDGAKSNGDLWIVTISPRNGIAFNKIKDTAIDIPYYWQDFSIYHRKSLEVIGNIYQNLDLFEQNNA